MTYFRTKFSSLQIVLLCLFLSACNSGGDKESEEQAPTQTSSTVSITGIVAKGLVNAALVVAYEVGANGELGNQIGSAETDAEGHYSIDLIATYAGGPVKVEVVSQSQTTMKCDISPACSDSVKFGEVYPVTRTMSLSTMVDLVKDEDIVNVTALTTLAAEVIIEELAQNGSDADSASVAQDISRINAEIADLFGLSDDTTLPQMPVVDLTDVDALGQADEETIKYSILGPAIVQVVIEDDDSVPVEEALEKFITDGLADNTDETPIVSDSELKDVFDESLELIDESFSEVVVTVPVLIEVSNSIEEDIVEIENSEDETTPTPEPTPEPTQTWTVSGTISGLNVDETISLTLNDVETIAVTSGDFSFTQKVNDQAAFAVAVSNIPEGIECTLSNGSGTAAAEVTNVTLSCAPILPIIGLSSSFTISQGQSLLLTPTITYTQSRLSSLQYQWELVSGDAMSVGGLTGQSLNLSIGETQFLQAKYRLLVTDDQNRQVSAETTINTNILPFVDLGPDYWVMDNSVGPLGYISLKDDNSESLTFAWSVVNGSGTTLLSSSEQTPFLSLSAQQGQTLTARLTVTDPHGASASDEQMIEVRAPAVYAEFNVGTGQYPVPNDLMFQTENADGSFVIPGSDEATATPPMVALENLSGASLVAPIDIEMSGAVDPSTVDARAFVLNPSFPAPNPAQTVFLLDLDYASEDPLSALTNREVPRIPSAETAIAAAGTDEDAQAQLLDWVNAPLYEASVITQRKPDGSDGHYIRINPLKPLLPNRRYVVVITNEVKDLSGNPITRAPWLAGYDSLSDQANNFGENIGLSIAQSMVNDLWEAVTTTYFGLTNSSRSVEPDLTEANIAFSMGITTTNDTQVIDHIVEPEKWLSKALQSKVKVAAAQSAVASGASDYATIKTSVDTALDTWSATAFSASLASCDALIDATYIDRFNCAASGIAAGLSLNFPTPVRDTTVPFTNKRDFRSVSSYFTDTFAQKGSVNISEGVLTVPYYQGIPNSRGVSDGSEGNIVNEWWKADSSLASALNAIAGDDGISFDFPQASSSDVVNEKFPFPQVRSFEEIPVLAIFPASDANKPAEGYKTIIYQHGNSLDRSAALAIAGYFIELHNGTAAVIAIDQPLHGIDVISEEGKLSMAETFLTGGQSAGFPAELAPSAENNQALVDGTLAVAYVTSTLNGQALINTADGISVGEQATIDSVFTNNLVTQVATAGLDSLSEINTSDGIDGSEQLLIDNAETGTFAYDMVATKLDTDGFIHIDDGIDAAEDSVINSVLDGSATDPGLQLHFDAAFALLDLETKVNAANSLEVAGFPSVADALKLNEHTVANGASVIPGLGQGSENERHFGFAGVNQSPVPMDFVDGTVGSSSTSSVSNTGSGALMINNGNFLNTRDNYRQNILDLMTLRLSIPSMDLDADGQSDLDTNNVYMIGHSLGTTSTIPFVEVVNNTETNADDIKYAMYLSPIGHIARVGENSNSAGPLLFNGLQSIGIERGDENAEVFLNVMQASYDAFDPVNFAENLTTTATTTKALFIDLEGDKSAVNNITPAQDVVNPSDGQSYGQGFDVPLAGSESLQTLTGATYTDSGGSFDFYFARFTSDSGYEHWTPVFPGTSSQYTSFFELGSIIETFVVSNGGFVTVNNYHNIFVDPSILQN